MKDINDIKDDQIRVLGDTVKEKSFLSIGEVVASGRCTCQLSPLISTINTS